MEKYSKFCISAVNEIVEYLKNDRVTTIYLTRDFKRPELLSLLPKNGVTVNYVDRKELATLCPNMKNQGVVAVVEGYNFLPLIDLIKKSKEVKNPVIVMLDGIQDPHNVGAILRSCDAFGVTGIIIKKFGQASINATVSRISTGAINYIPVCQVTNLSQTLIKLKEEGFWAVATDGNASICYDDIDYNLPLVVIIGSEGEGVSKLLKQQSDFICKIPMVGHVNSLNASVSCGVFLSMIQHLKK